MTEDDEIRLMRQENTIFRLRAENAEMKARCASLQRLYDNAQRHIERLERKLDAAPNGLAEAVFRRAAG